MKRISIIIIVVCRLLSAAWATHYSIPLTGGRMEVTAGRIRMVEGWLPGYTKRIKLTIDNTKIEAELTNFPVTVFLTSTQGEEIFSELDADADYMKVAFAASDGTNQLYAEKELFDVSESNAIYHVSKAGWTISDSGDTDFYMYYYNDASDNTNYIGAINTTAGATVWDSNFKAVYHMADETTSNILDSTSNNNDGAKKGANEPIEATGKVGQGQDFDGAGDYIDLGTNLTFAGAGKSFVLEAIAKTDKDDTDGGIVCKWNGTSLQQYLMKFESTDDLLKNAIDDSIVQVITSASETFLKDTWKYIVFVADNGTMRNYINGAASGVTGTYGTIATTTNATEIGVSLRTYGGGSLTEWFDGIIDEVRISSTPRLAAWTKATYNSLWDTLVSYGDEER